MTNLRTRDIVAVGFMTFALFIGAGNIIFPPIIAQQAGQNVWLAAFGFLVTGVSLPVITIMALSRMQGSMQVLSSPLGKTASMLLAIVCYLAIGPLFAMPRTAAVSYEIGFSGYFGATSQGLFIYSVLYFSFVAIVALYPNKLLDTVGYVLSPLKILALAVLGIAAVVAPSGGIPPAIEQFATSPFSEGFVNGYLTLDTLAALVFGSIIVQAIRSRGVTDEKLITKYAVISGIISGICLTLVYLSLFKLGMNSHMTSPSAENGAVILHAYVEYLFGDMGAIFLTAMIFLACLVTAIGLTCACSEYFSKITKIPYKVFVFILVGFSLVISNLGLTKLLAVTGPVLYAIYPPAIVVIILSFFWKMWKKPSRVVSPVAAIALLFGIFDGLRAAELNHLTPSMVFNVPLVEQNLAWLLPSLVVLVIATVIDRVKP